MTGPTSNRKAETRARIVKSAAERIRKSGIDGSGVATLMRDAGLTIGGFYAHFASKEELVKEAVLHALQERPAMSARHDDGSIDLERFIDRYLSTGHRDRPEHGCVVAALVPELLRRPRVSRKAFLDEAQKTIVLIANSLPDEVHADERLSVALSVFSHLLGTLQMARFVTDKHLSAGIMERGRGVAKRLAGLDVDTAIRSSRGA